MKKIILIIGLFLIFQTTYSQNLYLRFEEVIEGELSTDWGTSPDGSVTLRIFCYRTDEIYNGNLNLRAYSKTNVQWSVPLSSISSNPDYKTFSQLSSELTTLYGNNKSLKLKRLAGYYKNFYIVEILPNNLVNIIPVEVRQGGGYRF